MDGSYACTASSSPLHVPNEILSHRTSSLWNSTDDKHSSPTSPSRQQRLLHGRNARFPAKRLSISGLSNKLTQVIDNGSSTWELPAPLRNQENKLQKIRSTGTISKTIGLGILEEISNTARGRSSRQPPVIPIFQDSAEDSLVLRSTSHHLPLHIASDGESVSSTDCDNTQSSIDKMRFRELSTNQLTSSNMQQPHSLKSKHKTRPSQHQFDADEYIEHIEKELQQVRDEAYSPLTRRPMKEKLKAINKENARLQKELVQLKEKFETEVKRTVEHKTMTEVELRRRVRDLEDTIGEKDNLIHELQCEHEERRLDINILETLKATIDRLEEEKSDLEDINLGMSKRNEVLTQLLAMSPTKAFHNRYPSSPSREKRNARPISLILPRPQPSSKQISQTSSMVCSPQMLNSADISPLKLSPDSDYQSPNFYDDIKHDNDSQQPDLDEATRVLRSPFLQQTSSRRWTMLSDISTSSTNCIEDSKPHTKRKPRKFVAGSTQLKPLLLPALTGETISSASTASSPRSWPVNDGSESDVDETIMADNQMKRSTVFDHAATQIEAANLSGWSSAITTDGPGPACESSEIDPQNEAFRHKNPSSVTRSYKTTNMVEPCPVIGSIQHHLKVDTEKLEHQSSAAASRDERLYIESWSMQSMPMPSTPDSLTVIPQPLFSPTHRNERKPLSYPGESGPLASPTVSLSSRIGLHKRHRTSLPENTGCLPILRGRCSQRTQSLASGISFQSRSLDYCSRTNPTTEHQQLFRQLRSVRSSNNFAEIFHRKNFALKPLSALTIRTIFKILATCTTVVRDVRRDPFALARRVLANAWHMNWKVLGKLSWWVLGLFVQPHPVSKARAAIDWDQYDGESIASKYCISLPDCEPAYVAPERIEFQDDNDIEHNDVHDSTPVQQPAGSILTEEYEEKPGWTRSLFLWGKFSTAIMLAVGGAVVKGPAEMLKDIQEPHTTGLIGSAPGKVSSLNQPRSSIQLSRCSRNPKLDNGSKQTISVPEEAECDTIHHENCISFDSGSDSQLDSSSLLCQIQQPHRNITLQTSHSE